ncbi:hypothetical protein Aazo_2605 ['Nostoc azollae' 0708]|uniref:Uncharacterized protein n=1 Tax=Nostoc azollae (strain 0708) TaxID=551115 RepID=D7DZ16_NOSA0|nr:hypothetical protein Aazo_2605 ['Nostoc azollae' 0708]
MQFLGTGTFSLEIYAITGLGLNQTSGSIQSSDTSITSGLLKVEYIGQQVRFEFSSGVSIPIFAGAFFRFSYWKRQRHLKSAKLS